MSIFEFEQHGYEETHEAYLSDLRLGFPDISVDGKATELLASFTELEREALYSRDKRFKPTTVDEEILGLVRFYHANDPHRKFRDAQGMLLDKINHAQVYAAMHMYRPELPVVAALKAEHHRRYEIMDEWAWDVWHLGSDSGMGNRLLVHLEALEQVVYDPEIVHAVGYEDVFRTMAFQDAVSSDQSMGDTVE